MGDIIESVRYTMALLGLLTMICRVILVLCHPPQ
jgi:hypothetical protein